MVVVLEVYDNSVLGAGSRKCAWDLNLIDLNSRCISKLILKCFSECVLELAGIAGEVFGNWNFRK